MFEESSLFFNLKDVNSTISPNLFIKMRNLKQFLKFLKNLLKSHTLTLICILIIQILFKVT